MTSALLDTRFAPEDVCRMVSQMQHFSLLSMDRERRLLSPSEWIEECDTREVSFWTMNGGRLAAYDIYRKKVGPTWQMVPAASAWEAA